MPTDDNHKKTQGKHGNTLMAAFFIIAAAIDITTGKSPWNIFTASGFMLFAWVTYFHESPNTNSTIKEVHRFYRKVRWKEPRFVRNVMLLSTILILAGIIGSCSHPT